jgi:hypothetical protein
LALRVGYIGPWSDAVGLGRDYSSFTARADLARTGVLRAKASFRAAGVQLTTNLELVRTRGI